ncbi:MAG: DUF2399 domain-containing protein [Anaerolineales bacterium]|nr:DUF2399 domain-containing protein [Anaerolineales bacterium]
MVEIAFTPSDDVAAALHALLDAFERRPPSSVSSEERSRPALRSIKIRLDELEIPGYFSQIDPNPRRVANQQLQALEQIGWLHLTWQPGESGHLLEAISMSPDHAPQISKLLKRTPLSEKRARLADLILGERFRFSSGWQPRAVECILAKLKAGQSPAPFSLVDQAFNADLLTALAALDALVTETPYRVFSVRLFNDSKRFEDLKSALVRLARLGHPEWRALSAQDVLRELQLVPNPDYIYLAGPWELVDELGQVISLGAFTPSVGIPAAQAAGLQRVTVQAARVICVENATAFHELNRSKPASIATLCLWGNPSPACRHLLGCLAENLAEDISLQVWADLDYGGFNILAMLRKYVSARFAPYRMDIETLENHAKWAHPLTRRDHGNLKRLTRHPALADVHPVIRHMLGRDLKLEQEAIEGTL